MSEGESPFGSFDFPINNLTSRPSCDMRNGDYPIELHRCDTPEKILGEIEQLGDRARCQPLLRDFVLAATKHNFEIG